MIEKYFVTIITVNVYSLSTNVKLTQLVAIKYSGIIIPLTSVAFGKVAFTQLSVNPSIPTFVLLQISITMIPLATFDAKGANVTSLQLQRHSRPKHEVYGGHIYHVYLNSHFKDAIDNFQWLADDVTNRPTCIAGTIPEAPAYVGKCDASGISMGSVWLPDAHST